MLCIIHKRDICCCAVSVRLYVRLSVTFVYCVERSKRIHKLFNHLVHNILVFLYQNLWQYFDGELLTGAWNAGYMKNCVFRPTSRFISEMIQNRAMATMECEIANRKPYTNFWIVTCSMALSDIEWLGEIFNDTKHRAASLWQLGVLSTQLPDQRNDLDRAELIHFRVLERGHLPVVRRVVQYRPLKSRVQRHTDPRWGSLWHCPPFIQIIELHVFTSARNIDHVLGPYAWRRRKC